MRDRALPDFPLRLSDAIITGCQCTACGPLPSATRCLHRRAADFDDAIATCAGCNAPSVRIEIRDRFTLGELMQRFGDDEVPAKFAVAELDGGAICIDLEEYPPT